jgi:hypothetical protein
MPLSPPEDVLGTRRAVGKRKNAREIASRAFMIDAWSRR